MGSRLSATVLQGVFALLYHFGGRIYDPLTVLLFGGAWDEWRAATIDLLLPGRALDLGCGTGAYLAAIREAGFSGIGVELEGSMLSRARRRGVVLVRANAGALPFPTASIDTCVATYPAPFILRADVQAEIARVLRPGGRVVVLLGGTPDRSTIPRLLRPFIYLLGSHRGRIDAPLLSDPQLPGHWEHLRTRRGIAHIWVGCRE